MTVAVPGATAYARAFAVFGIGAILLLAFAIPPWQSPDEPAHFMRADQISRGGLIAHQLGTQPASGGVVSSGIETTVRPFVPMHFKPDVKTTPQMFAQAAPVTWANSADAPAAFSNTALYPPLLYLPSTAAIVIGKVAELSIVRTLRLARIANGLVSIVIGAVAIALAGIAAPWMFAVLVLPTSLSLMASASHDGPMFACAALGAAILFNAYPGGRFANSLPAFAVMCAAIALVTSARPTYLPLAIVPLLVSGQRIAVRIAGAAGILALTLAWSRIVAPLVLFQTGNGADPEAQMALLRADPLNFVLVVLRTLIGGFPIILEMFVGRLGWLDTFLPHPFHLVARLALFVALLATVAGIGFRRFNARGLLVMAAIAGGCVGLCLSLYLVWTRPGELFVVGVAGRYFIPLAVFVPAAVPFCIGPPSTAATRAAFVALLLFAPISIAVTLFAVLQRYY